VNGRCVIPPVEVQVRELAGAGGSDGLLL